MGIDAARCFHTLTVLVRRDAFLVSERRIVGTDGVGVRAGLGRFIVVLGGVRVGVGVHAGLGLFAVVLDGVGMSAGLGRFVIVLDGVCIGAGVSVFFI